MGVLHVCSYTTYYPNELVIFAFGQSCLMSPARVGVELTQVGNTQQNEKGTRPC